jgi:uncharacterized protein (DUF2141 family)
MHKFIYLLFIFFVVVLYSCANIKPPTGGPEDTKPPVVKRFIPKNNSTNFKGKTITLEFDEFIDAQKLRENIIISPLIESQYDIVVRKKTLTLKFKENFKENTTYNLNLGESIKDLTKGNYIKNLNIAFSTGPIIDSLILKGSVYNFVKGGPMKDVSIQLYSTADTNNILNSKPLYFTETDEAGTFTIKNIKEGVYDVYALQDINTNFKYDNEKEAIAYVYDVKIDKKVSNIKLGLTRTDTKAPEILSKKQDMDSYILTLNEGIESYSISAGNKKVLSEISDNNKTIKIFNNFKVKDSIELFVQLKDSSGNAAVDTAKIFFADYKVRKGQNYYGITVEPKKLQILKNENITLILNKPIDKINYSQISLKQDSTKLNLTEKDLQLDTNLLKINILNKYPFKDSLILNFQKGAFISFNGDSSLPVKAKFRYKNEEDYGILAGTIICKEPVYIFQLIDSKGKIIDSKTNATKFYYKFLEPGDYQLKIIIDVNNNGRWDATNIYKDIPPEPIKYYKEKISLRANWELLDLKFEVK